MPVLSSGLRKGQIRLPADPTRRLRTGSIVAGGVAFGLGDSLGACYAVAAGSPCWQQWYLLQSGDAKHNSWDV